jgi:hypothetical protein
LANTPKSEKANESQRQIISRIPFGRAIASELESAPRHRKHVLGSISSSFYDFDRAKAILIFFRLSSPIADLAMRQK